MHFLHRWLAITLFPRSDIRPLQTDDLRLLYAMVHKIRVSPIKVLVAHWQSVFERAGPIEFTSIITRNADTLNQLDGAHHF